MGGLYIQGSGSKRQVHFFSYQEDIKRSWFNHQNKKMNTVLENNQHVSRRWLNKNVPTLDSAAQSAASNFDALSPPLVSVLHLTGSAVEIAVICNMQHQITQIRPASGATHRLQKLLNYFNNFESFQTSWHVGMVGNCKAVAHGLRSSNQILPVSFGGVARWYNLFW